MTCCQVDGIERQFDRANANKELRRLRRRGPASYTRLLLDALLREGIEGAALLDIGGGVGTIHHVLLDSGAREAIHVDVSDSYLEVAREEAARRGHSGQVTFIHGDFVAVAASLPTVDVVTLDRVICCYPDMPALVDAAAGKTTRLLGAVYPRDAWWMRVAVACVNGLQRLKRSTFRLYLHSPAAIAVKLHDAGFVQRALHRTAFWEIVVYRRERATR